MTQSFLDMLHLFSCGAMGVLPDKKKYNFAKVRQHANKHGVWSIIILLDEPTNLKSLSDVTFERFSAEKYTAVHFVVQNIKKTNYIHTVIRQFEKERIECGILKGESLAILYADPDYRISSDTDIFISKKDKRKAKKLLLRLGFEMLPYNGLSHHIDFVHPIAGVIELHLKLYQDLQQELWFNKCFLVQEQFRKITLPDGTVASTLGYTDGLIFTALHFIKHFLSGGVGVRQLMDMLLYMKKYKDIIDWKRFDDLMVTLKFTKFIASCVGIGIKYMLFKKEDLPFYIVEDELMTKILTDMETGGKFGKEESERKGFYLTYSRFRFNRFKTGSFNLYIKRWSMSSLIRSLFPSAKRLSVKMPYLKRGKALYPVAWIHMMIMIGISLIKKEKSLKKVLSPARTDCNDTIKKRMELIRELEMV